MNVHALTIEADRDGPVCTLILHGDLDLLEVSGFLAQAALIIDDRTERLVLDLAGVTFLDSAGVQALGMARSFAPSGCPVIIRSFSPMARRILELLDPGLENLRELSAGQDLRARLWNRTTSEQELAPVEPGYLDLDV
jgi:anti-anti-sigma factor